MKNSNPHNDVHLFGESFFENHPDPMFVLDLEGKFIRLNPAMSALTGYTGRELYLQSFLLLIKEDLIAGSIEHFNNVVKGQSSNYHVEGKHKDGRRIQLQIKNFPIMENGRVTAVCGIAIDLNESIEKETSLHTLKQQVESFSNHPHDAFVILDLSGKIQKVNSVFEKMFGWALVRVVGKRLDCIVPKEFVLEVETLYKAVKFGGQIIGYETTGIRRDGKTIRMSLSIVPIRDDNGHISAFFAWLRDNTVLQKTNDELIKSVKELSAIKHALVTNSIMAITDVNGIIQYANDEFCEISKYKKWELIGQDHRIINSGHHPKQFFELLWKSIERGKVWAGDIKNKAKDGTFYWVRMIIVPYLDEEKNVYQYIGIGTHITEFYHAQDRLKALIDALPDVIIFKDDYGRWLEANQSALKLFGLEKEGYKGKTNAELAKFMPLFKQALGNSENTDENAWQNGSVVRIEENLQQSDGTRKTFEVVKVPLFYSNGQRKGLLEVARDITEQKRSEELLQNMENLSVIGELAAGIAHEIRNPLTTLRGFIQLKKTGAEKSEYFDLMLDELDRINIIVSELLLLAKQKQSGYRQENMQILLERVVTLFTAEANKYNVEIVTEFDEDIPLVKCEENKLKQVFINIVKNAIEAMPDGGKLLIQVKVLDQDRILIRIKDNGCGIPEEQISKLGQPFHTTKEKGTGLGLMISFKIIEDHGGTIRIISDEHQGTVVEVILPIILQTASE